MEVNERISEVLRYSQLSIKEFVLKTGIKTIQAVYDLLNGRTKSISSSVETKILSCFPEINRVWLLTGEGDMLNNPPQQRDDETEPSGHIRYWADVSASGGSVDFLMNPDEHESWLINPPNFPDCTDAVNFYGNSMFPLYKSGEIIVLKEWKESFINYGEVYLIVTKNGNRMVKYLHKSADESKVICRSENKDFDSFEIEKNDILRLFIVKGAITRKSV